MKKKLFILTVVIYSISTQLIKAQSISAQPFTVGGDGNIFYPVVFTETSNWNDGASELELSRSSVHLNASWWGSTIAKFRMHTSAWGNGANFIDADIRNNVRVFVADWRDVSTGNGSVSIVIWLRGQSTYYFRSTNSTMGLPSVYIGGYQEVNGPFLNPISTVNTTINQNGQTYAGSAYFGGITRTTHTEFYEGTVWCGFIGRGGSYTGGWAATPDALTISYAARDFAIGGWAKNGSGWKGASLYINSDNGNVGIGTTNPQNKLDVNGTIHAREVKVDLTGWSDFVFAPAYKLKTLVEVEQYIKTHNHLPEIPSAKEVEQNGVNVGDMQAKLLQKVEELTLYSIEQDKKLQEQELKNAELKQELKELKELVMRKME